MAMDYEVKLNKELSRPGDFKSESTASRIRSVCEPLLQAMLFCGEAQLTKSVSGTSGFSAGFVRGGIFDKQHRSLREFDLSRRLFKYPCSYLIYSEQFQELPGPAKNYLYIRLQEVLSGEDQSRVFDHLSSTDKSAILEILNETLPGFKKK